MKKKEIIILLIAICFFCAPISAQKRGYEKAVEINGGIGLDDINYTFGVSFVNGYRFNGYLYLGAGVGYEYLDGLYYHEYKHTILGSTSYDSYDVRNLVQVFARAKANFTNNRISPFVSCDIGNTIDTGSNNIKMANGLFFEPAVGCDFNIDDKQTAYIMLSYNGQHYEYDYFNLTLGNTSEEIIKELTGKLCIHLGFKF